MKKVGLLVMGTGIAIAIGSLAYYLYKQYQRKKALMSYEGNEEEELMPEKADVKEVMTQSLIEGMDVILRYQQLGIQLKSAESRNIPELKKGMREKRKVVRVNIVGEALKIIEKSVCKRLDWDIKDYYIEIARKEMLNDPYFPLFTS